MDPNEVECFALVVFYVMNRRKRCMMRQFWDEPTLEEFYESKICFNAAICQEATEKHTLAAALKRVKELTEQVWNVTFVERVMASWTSMLKMAAATPKFENHDVYLTVLLVYYHGAERRYIEVSPAAACYCLCKSHNHDALNRVRSVVTASRVKQCLETD